MSIFSIKLNGTFIYLFVTILVFIISLKVSNDVPVEAPENTLNYSIFRKDKTSKLCISAVTIILVLFSAFRIFSSVHTDEWAYRRRFDHFLTFSFSDAYAYSSEHIFDGLVWVSTRIFHSSQGIIIITGSITVFLYLYFIKKNCKDYAFGVLLIMLSCVFFDTFNGIQQCLATGVFLLSVDKIHDRKFIKYILLIAVCTFIHYYSIVLIALFFFGNLKFKYAKSLIWSIIAFFAIILLYNRLPDIIKSTAILTEYYDSLTTGHHGVGIFRIIVNIAPAVFAFTFPKELYESDKKLNLFANIALFHAVIYLVSSMDTYIARIALFTAPIVIIFLVNLIAAMEDSNKRITKLITTVLYFIFAIVQLQGSTFTFNLAF